MFIATTLRAPQRWSARSSLPNSILALLQFIVLRTLLGIAVGLIPVMVDPSVASRLIARWVVVMRRVFPLPQVVLASAVWWSSNGRSHLV